MKKLFGILALILLGVLALIPDALAQSNVEMQVKMYKDVSSKGETYGISFELSNDVLKKVTRVYVQGPRGARIWVNNTLDLNGIVLSAVNLSSKEFRRWFPEGNYSIILTPPTFRKLEVSLTHDFPPTPAVLSPLDGSEGVPTNPIILWTPVTGITDLRLQLKNDAGFSLSFDLPTNATSYSVPAGLLNPNTLYELSLEGKKATDSEGNGLVTTTLISFRTGQ